MSTIILFPLSRTAVGRNLRVHLQRKAPVADLPQGGRVIILPVVRIERHGTITPSQTGRGECAILSGYFGMETEGPHPA